MQYNRQHDHEVRNTTVSMRYITVSMFWMRTHAHAHACTHQKRRIVHGTPLSRKDAAATLQTFNTHLYCMCWGSGMVRLLLQCVFLLSSCFAPSLFAGVFSVRSVLPVLAARSVASTSHAVSLLSLPCVTAGRSGQHHLFYAEHLCPKACER